MTNQVTALPQNEDDSTAVKVGMDEARDAAVRAALGPVCLALGFLFIFLAATGSLIQGWSLPWWALFAVVTPVIYFSAYVAWRPKRLGAATAQPALSLAVLLSLLLRRVRMASINQAESLRRLNARQQIELEKLVQQRTVDLQAAYDQLKRLDQAKSDFINIASLEQCQLLILPSRSN